MTLTVRLFGLELLHIEIATEIAPGGDDSGPGDCTTQPIGFTASPGDQRWERGVVLE